ncbi:MAG: substrate-binding domain-containing protein [Kiritimatiellia bacterium]|nr:substrate-binding domain-containing protein [Kiritimatiellia bacterium]
MRTHSTVPGTEDPSIRRVVALINGNHTFGRDLIAWLDAHKPPHWRLVVTGFLMLNPWLQLKRLNPHGILIQISIKDHLPGEICQQVPLVALGRPAVVGTSHPVVATDDRKVAERVVEHFLEMGLKQLAFLGHPDEGISMYREAALRDIVKAAGLSCGFHNDIMNITSVRSDAARVARLVKWLKSLPKPVGLFAHNDAQASFLMEVCLQAGFRIPDEIAVVGVDNDPIICEGCEIPISSVSHDVPEIARQGRDLLDALMEGTAVPQTTIDVPPLSLVVRRSSGLHSIQPVPLTLACEFIRRMAWTGIGVRDVVSAACISRRTLERAFREKMGCSIHEEIQRVQMDHARELLHGTDRLIKEIAMACGFPDVKRFGTLFKKVHGCSPAVWRAGDHASDIR